jgi:predicted ribosome quality control (RQC) complex YloA/Tae2 family protein
MAFDGIVIAGLVHELNQTILNTKISKIAQPENDELLLTCKGSSGQFRVSISANASLPFLYLTDTNKTSPLQAPTFCMVLRKHIANGRIISITQPHMERIIHLKIEHMKETVQANYRRIKEEVKQIVQEELERIANDDNLKHLLQQK